MSKIEVLVFLHILGALMLAGGAGVGMATGIGMSTTESVGAIRLLSSLAHRGELFVAIPGALLTLITGVWLIADYPFFEWDEFWLWGSIVLWVVASGIALGVQMPFVQGLHRQADQLEAEGVTHSAELREAAGAPTGKIGGMALTLLNVVFLYLMVFRPGG